MACNEWNDQWVARLYDELDPDENRRVDEHLSRCASCREAMEALAGTRQMLRDSATPVPHAPRVVVLQPRRFRQPAWAFAAGMAAAAMLFALAIYALPLRGAGVGGDEVAAMKARLAELERTAALPTVSLTREQFDAEMARWARRIEIDRARDVEFLLGEITAVEHRTGDYINDNSQRLLHYALASKNPGLSRAQIPAGVDQVGHAGESQHDPGDPERPRPLLRRDDPVHERREKFYDGEQNDRA